MTRAKGLLAVCVVAYACTTYDDGLKASGGSQVDSGGQAGASAGSPAGGSSSGSAATSGGGELAAPSAGAAGDVAGGESSGGAPGGEGGVLAGGGDAGAGGEGPDAVGSGMIKAKRWDDLPGWNIATIPVDSFTANVTLLGSLEWLGQGESYGLQILGFLTAPSDGQYRFWIACDNNCQLQLSSDESVAGLKVIAYVVGYNQSTDAQQWDKYPSQASATLALKRGKRYRLDVRMKQDTASSHVSVAWQQPGQTLAQRQVIPGAQLTPDL